MIRLLIKEILATETKYIKDSGPGIQETTSDLVITNNELYTALIVLGWEEIKKEILANESVLNMFCIELPGLTFDINNQFNLATLLRPNHEIKIKWDLKKPSVVISARARIPGTQARTNKKASSSVIPVMPNPTPTPLDLSEGFDID